MRQFKARPINQYFPNLRVCDPVDPEAWRRALQTIFTELRSSTFPERRAVLRQLYDSLSTYAHVADLPRPPTAKRRPPTAKQLNKWTADVRKHAGKLADLLNSVAEYRLNTPDGLAHVIQPLGYPKILGPKTLPGFIDQLRTLEEATKRRFSSRRGPKESHFAPANSYLIHELNEMYVAATGKQGGAGRVHDHYEGADATRQGRPDGPFFRLIKAALVLVGDTQSDEAIFEAIQDHTAEVKIEKLTEEVNAAISDDLKETLYAPHKSKEALKKALRDHRTRARKLIDSAKAEEKRLAKRRLPDRAGLTTHSLN